jgi:glycosyltransferase involved in cell wall biosynthesis
MLILCASTQIGGTERVACLIHTALAKRGWDIRMALPAGGSSEALEWFHSQGVIPEAITCFKTPFEKRSYKDVLALAKFIRSTDVDVVNLHYGSNEASLTDVLSVRLAGKTCVITIHHISSVGWKTPRKMKLAARLASSLVVTTRVQRRYFTDWGIPAQKIHVIPNGIAPPSLRSRDEARERLGVPSSAFVISSLARLTPEKGIQDLLHAVADADDPNRRFLVLVGGDGPNRLELEAQATSLGQRVRFLGRLEDPDELYAASDLFVLPSYEEGFGLVFVEASSHHIPSIGTRVGGVPEVVVDGETGVLVPAGDVASLRQAIEFLATNDDLRIRLGRQAGARAEAEFSVNVMADRYHDLLKSNHKIRSPDSDKGAARTS